MGAIGLGRFVESCSSLLKFSSALRRGAVLVVFSIVVVLMIAINGDEASSSF